MKITKRCTCTCRELRLLRYSILLLLSSALAPAVGRAQSWDFKDWSPSLNAGLEIGYWARDLGVMSNVLNNTATSEPVALSGSSLIVGGAAFVNVGQIVVGGSARLLPGSSAAQGTETYQLSAFEGFGHLGLTVLELNYLKLYPLLGIGSGTMQTKFTDPDNVQSESARWSSLLFDISLGADFFYLFPLQEGAVGPKLGIRVGYTFSPASAIERDFNAIPTDPFLNAESYSAHTFHLALSIGGIMSLKPKYASKTATAAAAPAPAVNQSAKPKADPNAEKPSEEDTMNFDLNETPQDEVPPDVKRDQVSRDQSNRDQVDKGKPKVKASKKSGTDNPY